MEPQGLQACRLGRAVARNGITGPAVPQDDVGNDLLERRVGFDLATRPVAHVFRHEQKREVMLDASAG